MQCKLQWHKDIAYHTPSNARQCKFVNLKNCYAQFHRKTTAYADILMMYINLPVHGDIQDFTNETTFCNCYSFWTIATMVGKKIKE